MIETEKDKKALPESVEQSGEMSAPADNNEKKRHSPSKALLADIEAYIRKNYVPEEVEDYAPDGAHDLEKLRKGQDDEADIPVSRIDLKEEAPVLSDMQESEEWKDLQDVISHVGETFQQMLFRLIKNSGMSEVEIYQKAQIDRKVFSKIRRNPDYIPRKGTVLALAIALHLNLDETKDLLSRAGQALSPGSKRDLIVEYCIRNKIYDLFEVNEILYKYQEPVLP